MNKVLKYIHSDVEWIRGARQPDSRQVTWIVSLFFFNIPDEEHSQRKLITHTTNVEVTTVTMHDLYTVFL